MLKSERQAAGTQGRKVETPRPREKRKQSVFTGHWPFLLKTQQWFMHGTNPVVLFWVESLACPSGLPSGWVCLIPQSCLGPGNTQE